MLQNDQERMLRNLLDKSFRNIKLDCILENESGQSVLISDPAERSVNHEEVESIIKEVLMKTKKSKDKNWDLKESKTDDIKVVRADMRFIVLIEELVDIEQDYFQIEMMDVDGLFDVRALKRKLGSESQSTSK
ncbi:41370_t:CDS:2, partial [Gigaspora margarita]